MTFATDEITTPEALDADALMLARFAHGDHWCGLDLARRLDAVKRVRGGLAGIASRPDRPSDLAPEVEGERTDRRAWMRACLDVKGVLGATRTELAALRAGIETLDLDVLEDVAFNLGHTVYDATELEPAECTDECNACFIEDTVARLRDLLAGREADR